MRLLFFLVCLLFAAPAMAAEADMYCLTGVKADGVTPNWQPAAPGSPCPTGTTPTGTSSTQTSGTVTLGGTFQTAIAANSDRKGCTLQNTSVHTMYVYVGTLGDATTGKSFLLGPGSAGSPGGTLYCSDGNIVVTGAINVTTSTTGDTWVQSVQ